MQPMMLISKKLPNFNSLPCLLRLSLFLSTIAHNPRPKSNFVVDYLVKTCGFPPKKAATASKHINFTSRSKPDWVRHFLKHNAGLTDVQINSVISRNFKILCANVDKTMQPNLDTLREITPWSTSEIQELIVANPIILANTHAISRLEFWKKILKGDMKKLLVAAKKNLGLLCYNVDKGTVVQKIAILEEYGLSQFEIGSFLAKSSGFLSSSTASMEVALKKAEGLGLRRGSLMFMRHLLVLSKIDANTFDAKIIFYKRYGWSEKEFLAAFSKAPYFLLLSEGNIREKVDFLVRRAGCDHSYIASHPVLLTFSLKKRLMPRLHVMNILTSRNLLGKMNLLSVMSISEANFVKFINQKKEKMPELHDIYIAACSGQIQL